MIETGIIEIEDTRSGQFPAKYELSGDKVSGFKAYIKDDGSIVVVLRKQVVEQDKDGNNVEVLKDSVIDTGKFWTHIRRI